MLSCRSDEDEKEDLAVYCKSFRKGLRGRDGGKNIARIKTSAISLFFIVVKACCCQCYLATVIKFFFILYACVVH